MRPRAFALLLAAASLAPGQALHGPRFGWMRDGAGVLRPLEGLAASAVPGEARATGVLSAASSGTWTLLNTSTELVALDDAARVAARLNTAAGPGLYSFNCHNGPAAVFLPAEGRLLFWREGRFEDAGWRPSFSGETLALAVTAADRVSFLVRRGDEIWRADYGRDNGDVTGETLLPGVTAPALLFAGGSVVYAAEKQIVFRGPGFTERRIVAPGAVTRLTPLNGDWIQATLAGRQMAVSFAGETPRAFELPEERP